jgi:outer membrane protein OmpA-like peptidoglycan-associated protein
MILSGKAFIPLGAAALTIALATTGCATKKYVSQQINPVNQRLNQYEKDTNGKITYLTNKEQNDYSQVNERIATTDQHVAELGHAVQSAQGTASRAMQEADANKVRIEANNAALANVRNSLNYQLVQKSDVEFGFNQATLTSQARAELDAIAAKARSMPRSVIELSGFADPVGSPNYNLDLSRRRAWAVQRYLVDRNVPARNIQVIGFGEEHGPQATALSSGEMASARGKTSAHRQERRVCIQLYGAGELAGGASTEE